MADNDRAPVRRFHPTCIHVMQPRLGEAVIIEKRLGGGKS